MLPGCAAMKLFPNKIISFERLRRALAKSTAWMDKALGESTQESLRTPWILDADTSVKLLLAPDRWRLVNPGGLDRQHPPGADVEVQWCGDSAFVIRGYGQNGAIAALPTAGVKRLIERQWQQGDWRT